MTILGPDEIREKVALTYRRLRRGLAATAFVFPLLLFAMGYALYGITLQTSMSAYYFAQMSDAKYYYLFPMRILFVGVLCAIGGFLIMYRGFSRTEDIYLTAAGAGAIGVAFFPMKFTPSGSIPCDGCADNALSFLHYVSAGALFLCIAIVAFACRKEILANISNEDRQWFRNRYDLLAAVIIIGPLSLFILSFFSGEPNWFIFFAELVGIMAFAAYWALKSYELDHVFKNIPPAPPAPPVPDLNEIIKNLGLDGGQLKQFQDLVKTQKTADAILKGPLTPPSAPSPPAAKPSGFIESARDRLGNLFG